MDPNPFVELAALRAQLERLERTRPLAGPPSGTAAGSVPKVDDTGSPVWSPRWDTDWTDAAHSSGWSGFDVSSPWGVTQYAKTRDGLVMLRGMAKKAGGTGDGASVLTLPAGMRPARHMMFASHVQISGGFGDTPCAVQILTTGVVSVRSYMDPANVSTIVTGHTVTFLSLNGIVFAAA